ncbi:hypothetical protein [Corynebacterium frankenforstense]|uniref:hypothetical protein n=1 Tax=Corynebacterium frankenforstense TaxID=1230998 RepID=UPI001B8008CC|nr:hypothetical protein [Corynebacterium frankenforstense]
MADAHSVRRTGAADPAGAVGRTRVTGPADETVEIDLDPRPDDALGPVENPVIEAHDLSVARDAEPVNFTVGEGLTVLRNLREHNTTALSLTLAGRRRAVDGEVLMRRDAGRDGRRNRGRDERRDEGGHESGRGGFGHTGARERFRRVALAGVPETDSLERQVPVRESIREQVAWALPFYRHAPRDIMAHPYVTRWSGVLGLEDLDPATPAGEIDVETRLTVRVMLALIARPDADLLIVDDIDQLRDMDLRAEMLERLVRLAEELPVIAHTVNDGAPEGARFLDVRRDVGEYHAAANRRAATDARAGDRGDVGKNGAQGAQDAPTADRRDVGKRGVQDAQDAPTADRRDVGKHHADIRTEGEERR